jgi:tRNA nucleotidyltransferase/poly(A) polymerase
MAGAGGVTAVPQPIEDWLRRLASVGHRAQFVGECVLQLLLGRQPGHYRAHSSIPADALFSLAPRAVPTGVAPLTITIPTPAGPLDIVPNQSREQTRLHLQTVPFSVLALALDPLTGELTAHGDAQSEISSGTLSPNAELASNQGVGFAIEAARLIAVYNLRPSDALLGAARNHPMKPAASRCAGLRRQLRELLTAPGVRAGLNFLRDVGAEEDWAPGVRSDAAAIVAQVPAKTDVRFCAWLQGADPRDLLRGLRFGGAFSGSLHHVLQHHPIDLLSSAQQETTLRRLQKRLSSDEISILLAMRRAEAQVLRESDRHDEADHLLRRLEELEQRLDRVSERQLQRLARTPLAISGKEIMQALACGPGPEVGQAIRHLSGLIASEPGANNKEELLRRLKRWWSER